MATEIIWQKILAIHEERGNVYLRLEGDIILFFEGDDWSVEYNTLTTDEVDADTLVQLGVITKDEAEERKSKWREKRNSAREEEERAKYEELKAKYENQS